MAKKIIWSRRANSELIKILSFFNDRNGNTTYSIKLVSQLEDFLLTLSKNEKIGKLTSNNTTRVCFLKTYLIFYDVDENNISILSFWDNRQDDKNKFIK